MTFVHVEQQICLLFFAYTSIHYFLECRCIFVCVCVACIFVCINFQMWMYVCLHVPNQVFLRCRTCSPYRLWYWSYRVLNQRMYRLAKAPYVVFLGWPTSFQLELGLCLDLLCMESKGLIPFTLRDAAAGCQFLRVPLCFSLKLLPTMKRERIERWQEKGGYALVSNWEIKGEKLMVQRRRNKMLWKRTEGKTVRGKERIEKTVLLTQKEILRHS